ncbi:hypothetical protein [Nonomuraea sp. NPDC050310]|uniref:hypothetical protein n=1 Tax=unclassified Nonomuraea TaxID=2593643 RepID=UPI0033DDF771
MDVVIDPGVPEDDARLLRENGELLARFRTGWVPEGRRKRLVGRVPDLAVVALVCGLLVLAGMAINGSMIVVIIALAVFLGYFARQSVQEEAEQHRHVYDQARWYEGRYVLGSDLDESARRLLQRARWAVVSITDSEVNREGLLDSVRNSVMLPAQEWEIARLLAKLSDLRGKHRDTVSQGMTAELAAVAEPLARALDSSEEAVVARVEALERYAEHVAEAEAAFHAHRQVEELRSRLPEYEELVAEAGAGAVPELDRLADDAGDLEQALRRSVSSAREAFGYLEPGA